MEDFYRIAGQNIGDNSWHVDMAIAGEIDLDTGKYVSANDDWATVFSGTFDACVMWVRELEKASV